MCYDESNALSAEELNILLPQGSNVSYWPFRDRETMKPLTHGVRSYTISPILMHHHIGPLVQCCGIPGFIEYHKLLLEKESPKDRESYMISHLHSWDLPEPGAQTFVPDVTCSPDASKELPSAAGSPVSAPEPSPSPGAKPSAGHSDPHGHNHKEPAAHPKEASDLLD